MSAIWRSGRVLATGTGQCVILPAKRLSLSGALGATARGASGTSTAMLSG